MQSVRSSSSGIHLYIYFDSLYIQSQDPPKKPHVEVSTTNTGVNDTVYGYSPLFISDGIVTARLGQEIIFNCKVESSVRRSNIPTTLIFKRNGNNFSSSKLYSNSITILAAENETDVVYECEAQNVVGSHISNKISMDIQCKLK